MISRRVVIAGGSGFVGLSLAEFLKSQRYEVVIVSRRPPKVVTAARHVAWDGRSVGDWRYELDGAAAVINLAGRSVDCVKTPDHQDEILRSRVESVRAIGAALRTLEKPPPVWVQMSTAHIYGDPPEVWCDEDSATGIGLAPTVGLAWEEALAREALPAQRTVALRTSFVLGRDCGAGCGALARLGWLAKLGLAGRIGSGQQGISWIHETDLNRMFLRSIEVDSMRGAYIASAPHPVPQVEFMRELRRAMGVRIRLPATEWMVRVGARWLLRTDAELALYGRYVVSRRLKEDGFEFQFSDVGPALREIYCGELSNGEVA